MITRELSEAIVGQMLDWCGGKENNEEDLYTLLCRITNKENIKQLSRAKDSDKGFLENLNDIRATFKRNKQI